MGILTGKKFLITGINSNRSIAYGVAKACYREGAELILTYNNERFKGRLEKFAEEFGGCPVVQLDVTKDESIAAVGEAIKAHWADGFDGFVHSIAWAPREAIEGSFLEGLSREGYLAAIEISAYSFAAMAKAYVRNYLKKGLFQSNQLDMIRPRFTSEKSSKRRIIRNIDLLSGRTYEDYLKHIHNNDSLIVQIDTVVGKLIDNKKLLTIHWPTFHFQIGILLEKLTPSYVNQALLNLKDKIGIELYKQLFQTILTDNGIEFSLLDEIEFDDFGELISHVFFCDPYSSSQKGACERNHEFIRYILPKGVSFDNLNQKDVDLIFSHINSTPRKSLGFNTPYNVFKAVFGIKILTLLNIKEINKDEVHLKPSLLK